MALWERLFDVHAWMQDTQNGDLALALDVEGDVLSDRKGSQARGDCVALSPDIRRQAEMLESELQLFTVALGLRTTPSLVSVANDLQQVGGRATRELEATHFFLSFLSSLSTAANARSRTDQPAALHVIQALLNLASQHLELQLLLLADRRRPTSAPQPRGRSSRS